jgi:nucleoside phosphorylase
VTPYWTPRQVIEEADKRGLRRALVLTALDLEMRAVLAHVETIATCIENDGTVFVCGVFSEVGQDWLVVTAETGAGTHDALGVTNKAYELFRPFDLQIFVGIGGSRKPDDAPLGSVVAASHVYMPYGAKEGEDGRSSRPREFVADPRLLGLAKKLRLEQQWPGRIKVPIDGPQPFSKDYPTAFPPIAHVAPMVSTEAVLANPQSDLAVLIARDFGDACIVEMEGFGAMHGAHRESTANIVIRGVSDMTEMKTPGDDKIRQPIAAAHAAGFAFELLAEYGLAFPRPRGGISATDAVGAETSRSFKSARFRVGTNSKFNRVHSKCRRRRKRHFEGAN